MGIKQKLIYSQITREKKQQYKRKQKKLYFDNKLKIKPYTRELYAIYSCARHTNNKQKNTDDY